LIPPPLGPVEPKAKPTHKILIKPVETSFVSSQ
jgi:hypothetical protein